MKKKLQLLKSKISIRTSYLFGRMIRVFPFLARFLDKHSSKTRFIRSYILRTESQRFIKMLNLLDFNQHILLHRQKGVYVGSDGIFLNANVVNRYFKVSGDRQSGNIAAAMNTFIEKFSVTLNVVVDVGANYGDVGLYFCRKYPNCRVICIEASSQNFKILQSNNRSTIFSNDKFELYSFGCVRSAWGCQYINRKGS